jgi:hypothetical protein
MAEDTVGWTRDAGWAAVEDVRVDLSRTHIIVAEQFLNGADVASIFQEVRGEGMAQRVRCFSGSTARRG